MTVEAPMRALVPVVTFAGLLGGCMAIPEAEELVFEDYELSSTQELQSIPEGSRPARPTPPLDVAPEPEPELVSAPPPPGGPPRFVPARRRYSCWAIDSLGFPAISTDGSTVVVPEAQHLQMSFSPGSLDLQWHDVAEGAVTRTEPVFVQDQWATDDYESCSRSAQRSLRRRARVLSEELAAGDWRTMERLPVELYYPYEYTIEEYRERLPPHERGVQALVQSGELIVRIAGVRVLERHTLYRGWGGLHAVFGDRETGTVALVTMACAGESCTCDPEYSTQLLHFAPETFDAIERRPCDDERLVEALGSSYCDPIELGYNDDPQPWSF